MGQRLGQQAQPFCCSSHFPIHFSQHAKNMRPCYLCPRGLNGGQALTYQGNALLSVSLSRQCVAPLHRSHGQVERKSMLSTQCDALLCSLLSYLSFFT